MYFDWSATSLGKPQQVIDAVCTAMTEYANPSRGAYEASLKGLRSMYQARTILAEYFGVADPSRVTFCQNATMALNTVIHSLEGHIVTTMAEHNSVLRPIYRKGNYTIVPVNSKGQLDYQALEDAVQSDTVAIVITHSSNVTGNGYDLVKIGKICAKKGIYFIVDGAQSAGLLPVHVDDMGISAFCFSGHKSLYGPQGTGGICCGKNFQPSSFLVGGSGVHTFDQEHPQEFPTILEAGTQNSHGIAGLLAGVEYVMEHSDGLDIANEFAKEFIENTKQNETITFYGDLESPLRTPVVSLNIAGYDSADLASRLDDEFDIWVRAGFHCAPLMHEALGTKETGAVRFSFSHRNTIIEVEQAIKAINDLAR